MKNNKRIACICLAAMALAVTSCSSKEATNNKGALATKAPTASPKATAGAKSEADEKLEGYKELIKGTWTSDKTKAVYTFDGNTTYTYKGEDKTTVGVYSFTTDSSNKMIVLGLDGNNEMVNEYFKITFGEDRINVVNGKGESEVWYKGVEEAQ